MRLYLALFIFISSTLYSCYFISHEITIDNPSQKKIKVIIDQEEFILSAKSILEVKLRHGHHLISVVDDSTQLPIYNKKNVWFNSAGILNISGSTYIIHKNQFTNFEKRDRAASPKKSIELNGYNYVGTLTKIDSSTLFVARTWDRGLTEEIRTIEELNPYNKTLTKIYRSEEFENDFLRNVR